MMMEKRSKLFIEPRQAEINSKNKLNDLSAKEWVKFSRSWVVYRLGRRDVGALIHPAPFPLELAVDFIQFFTHKGEWVLDPMVGAGTTLIACALTGRNGIGVELSPYWADIARRRIDEYIPKEGLFDKRESETQQIIITGDARDIDKIDMPPIRYVLTSPPYWDVLRRRRDWAKERWEDGLPSYYSDDERDLGNIDDYDVFLNELISIYRKVADKMAGGAYITIIVKNVKKGAKIYPLAWDLAMRLGEFLELKDEKIWCVDYQRLRCSGFPSSWASTILHHYCLIFRKP